MMDSFSSTPLGFNNSLAVSEVGQKLLDMYIGSILPAISGKAKSVQSYLPILGSDVKARLSLSWIISGVLTLLFVKSVVFSSRRFFKDKYPPGPPAIPFFGNLFQLSMDAWVPFTKWKKQYGETFHHINLKLSSLSFRGYYLSQRCWSAGNCFKHPQGRCRSSRQKS